MAKADIQKDRWNAQGLLRLRLEFAQSPFCQHVTEQSTYCGPAATQSFAISFAITESPNCFKEAHTYYLVRLTKIASKSL